MLQHNYVVKEKFKDTAAGGRRRNQGSYSAVEVRNATRDGL